LQADRHVFLFGAREIGAHLQLAEDEGYLGPDRVQLVPPLGEGLLDEVGRLGRFPQVAALDARQLAVDGRTHAGSKDLLAPRVLGPEG
jgi:hypothetical protein